MCKCGCIHKCQRTTFDIILLPLCVVASNSVLPGQRQTSSLTLCTCMCGLVGCARTHVCIHTPVQAGCGYYFLGDLSPYAWGGSLPLEPKAGRFSLLWGFPDYSLNTETTSNQGTRLQYSSNLTRDKSCKAAYSRPHYVAEVF